MTIHLLLFYSSLRDAPVVCRDPDTENHCPFGVLTPSRYWKHLLPSEQFEFCCLLWACSRLPLSSLVLQFFLRSQNHIPGFWHMHAPKWLLLTIQLHFAMDPFPLISKEQILHHQADHTDTQSVGPQPEWQSDFQFSLFSPHRASLWEAERWRG